MSSVMRIIHGTLRVGTPGRTTRSNFLVHPDGTRGLSISAKKKHGPFFSLEKYSFAPGIIRASGSAGSPNANGPRDVFGPAARFVSVGGGSVPDQHP